MSNALFDDLRGRMDGALRALDQEFMGLRTGRASVDLLNPVQVEAYGARTPLNQVGNVSADGRMLRVQVWDKGLMAAVEKAIRDAELGLNPATDGDTIRLTVPELNQERRQELVKIARKYAEGARVSVRNVRRDGMDSIKKMEKDGEISEDDVRRLSDQVQKLTDEFVSTVDNKLEVKEKDIMTV